MSNQPDPAKTSAEAMGLDDKYSAHNYHPIPCVYAKAKGAEVWDPEGKKYYDFLAAYSAVNQGHCHPKIFEAMTEQAQRCTLSSRAFHNDMFGKFCEYITKRFKFDMVLPMNSGAEAVETALKVARKWGYQTKKIPENKAIILAAASNFHGRSISIISMSQDPVAVKDFGPFTPNLGPVCPASGNVLRFNDVAQLEKALEAHGKNTAAFIVEPIQGEAGVFVPDEGYIKKCYDLCKKHNVLFIADEIQCGLARTGKMLCVEHDNVQPDILILGKALSGGYYPISCILANKNVLGLLKPGEHGSTFGGNPLAAAIGIAALKVLDDEGMIERSERQGKMFREQLSKDMPPFVKEVRGRGLMNALEVDPEKFAPYTAWDCCLLLKERGLLAKPTHSNIIRFTPPLCMTDEQLQECIDIIKGVLKDITSIPKDKIPGAGNGH